MGTLGVLSPCDRVELLDGRVVASRHPDPSGFLARQILSSAATASPLAFPELALPVSRLLRPAR